MSNISLFRRLRDANQLLEVGVDDVKVLLPGSDKRAIGTHGLNGCTCVVILGAALLLAHIAPLPGQYHQWTGTNVNIHQASANHHTVFLQRISTLVQQNATQFPPSSTAWGVFSVGSGGSLQGVIQQVTTHLTNMGYTMRPAFYEEIDPRETQAPKGELVSFQQGGVPKLYLERRQLWPEPSATAPSSTKTRRSDGRNQEDTQNDDNDNDDGDNNENDDEDGDENDSDDGDGNENDNDDDDRNENEADRLDQGTEDNRPVAASPAGPSQSRWVRQGNQYLKIASSGSILSRQNNPPLNEIFVIDGVPCRWDGSSRWTWRNGTWTRF